MPSAGKSSHCLWQGELKKWMHCYMYLISKKEYGCKWPSEITNITQIVAGPWFSPCTPVSSINKTDRHDITEILLEVALNTLTPIMKLVILNRLFIPINQLQYIRVSGLVMLKLGYDKKILWRKVLSKDCSFCPDPLTNMAAIGNSCFWLADFKKLLLWNHLAKWTETL